MEKLGLPNIAYPEGVGGRFEHKLSSFGFMSLTATPGYSGINFVL